MPREANSGRRGRGLAAAEGPSAKIPGGLPTFISGKRTQTNGTISVLLELGIWEQSSDPRAVTQSAEQRDRCIQAFEESFPQETSHEGERVA